MQSLFNKIFGKTQKKNLRKEDAQAKASAQQQQLIKITHEDEEANQKESDDSQLAASQTKPITSPRRQSDTFLSQQFAQLHKPPQSQLQLAVNRLRKSNTIGLLSSSAIQK